MTLNVLLVYYEPAVSGQSTHVLSLARALRQHRVTVVLPEALAALAPDFQQAGARVVSLPLRKVFWSLSTISAFTGLIRQEHFDIVHVHSQEAGLVGRALAYLAGARHILYTPQTIDIRRAGWHWLYALLEVILSVITERIISVNEADRRRLIRWGIPAAKVVAIPNGIDLARFSTPVDPAALRKKLGMSVERPLVMQVGRLSPQKDPFAFVEGARRILERHPEAQFALVGKGPLQEELASRIAALGLSQQVFMAGWQDDAWQLMAAAEVITLTSRWEGTPYSLLEAMACAKPVVATAVNGCPEIVLHGETGFLAPAGDLEAWVAGVARLLEQPAQAARMGQRGRQWVEEKFSTDKMGKQIEALYRQVL